MTHVKLHKYEGGDPLYVNLAHITLVDTVPFAGDTVTRIILNVTPYTAEFVKELPEDILGGKHDFMRLVA